jgi:two-component system chemotaxis sensor kinase CheA
MDVVKTSIDTLSGSVDVRSERGQGTTILIRLPLTLAIIEGLEVTIAGEHFVLPLSHVVECVELHRREGDGGEGRHLINVRGELVPYIRLREWFGISGTPPTIEQTVISLVGKHRVGLVVDHVIGEHQTVIKSLGKVYKKAEGFSGATILGDGSVALILDIPRLIRGAELDEVARVGREP